MVHHGASFALHGQQPNQTSVTVQALHYMASSPIKLCTTWPAAQSNFRHGAKFALHGQQPNQTSDTVQNLHFMASSPIKLCTTWPAAQSSAAHRHHRGRHQQQDCAEDASDGRACTKHPKTTWRMRRRMLQAGRQQCCKGDAVCVRCMWRPRVRACISRLLAVLSEHEHRSSRLEARTRCCACGSL